MVRYGLNTSSIRYNDRTDGRAVRIRIMMGAMVQAASSCSTSSVGSLWVRVVVVAVSVNIVITNVIKQVSRSTWSCRKTTSSIVGPIASCRDSWPAYGIENHRGCDLAMTKPCNMFTRFSGKKQICG